MGNGVRLPVNLYENLPDCLDSHIYREELPGVNACKGADSWLERANQTVLNGSFVQIPGHCH